MVRHFYGRVAAFAAAVAILILIPGLSAPASAQKIEEFTAEQVTISAKGKVEKTNDLAVTADRVRIERPVPRTKSDKNITVYRKDSKTLIQINPQKKVYFEGPYEEKELDAALYTGVKAVSEKAAGEESVGGFACTKKEVQYEIEEKKVKKVVTQTFWVSDRISIPLRVKTHQGQVIELQNLKQGKPDPALFEAPRDFKKAATRKEATAEVFDPFLDDDD